MSERWNEGLGGIGMAGDNEHEYVANLTARAERAEAELEKLRLHTTAKEQLLEGDLYRIVRALDIPARPYSGHEAMDRDILPSIAALAARAERAKALAKAEARVAALRVAADHKLNVDWHACRICGMWWRTTSGERHAIGCVLAVPDAGAALLAELEALRRVALLAGDLLRILERDGLWVTTRAAIVTLKDALAALDKGREAEDGR